MQNLPLTTKNVLLGAANLLRRHGWCVGETCAPDGRMCMVGAIARYIAEAPGDPVERSNAAADAGNAVTRYVWTLPDGGAHPHVTAWNDRQCRDGEHAAQVLEAAAGVNDGDR